MVAPCGSGQKHPAVWVVLNREWCASQAVTKCSLTRAVHSFAANELNWIKIRHTPFENFEHGNLCKQGEFHTSSTLTWWIKSPNKRHAPVPVGQEILT